MLRARIPKAVRERLISRNAGFCCVCKQRGLGVHIHHIDGDNSNNDDANLAVLCVGDHDRFHRPTAYALPNHRDLSAEEILKYKGSWECFVEEARAEHPKVLAVASIFGTYEEAHSVKLAFQRQ